MTLPIPSAPDYTDLDFDAIRTRLHTLLAVAFPEWTDFTRSRFENAIIDSFAFMFDVLAYYLDKRARDTRFGTVQLRRAMIELAKLIDYQLDTNSPALTDVVFSIPTITAGNVTIPPGTVVKTRGVGSQIVKFTTTAAATILAGALTSAATAVEQSEAQSYSATALGKAKEEWKLPVRPFLDGSDSMTIAGAPWTRVSDFLDSVAGDLHYTVQVDERDYAYLRVGDGVNGSTAAVGAAVAVSYKTGGGEAGNVDIGAIVKVEGAPWYDALGNQVSLSCANAAAAIGGAERETVDEARVRAPRALRVLSRCVARTDYEDLAIQVSGVARALSLSHNEDATIPEGRGRVWIVPSGGGVAPGALLAAVSTYIDTNYPVPMITSYDVLAAPYVTMNVVAYVYLEEGITVATVIAAIRQALTDLLAEEDTSGDPNELVNFGYYYRDSTGTYDGQFPYSDVENAIRDVSGVRRMGVTTDGEGMTLNGVEGNVTLLRHEFPEAGTLTLRDGDTGLVIYTGAI